MFIRIEAPHFVAGIELKLETNVDGPESDYVVYETAPIVKYMRYWKLKKVLEYCSAKKWDILVL